MLCIIRGVAVAGVSRSVSILLMYWIVQHRIPLKIAFTYVKSCRWVGWVDSLSYLLSMRVLLDHPIPQNDHLSVMGTTNSCLQAPDLSQRVLQAAAGHAGGARAGVLLGGEGQRPDVGLLRLEQVP